MVEDLKIQRDDLEKQISKWNDDSKLVLEEFKIAKASNLDSVQKHFNQSVKSLFIANKALKFLNKAIKQLEKIGEV